MKRAPLKLAALGDRIEDSRLFWVILVGAFVVGYAHLVIRWIH